MKVKELYLGILLAIISIFTIACSKNAALSDVTTKKGSIGIRNAFFPSRIVAVNDTIVAVGFFQTAVPHYLNLNDPNSKKNLEIIRKAHQNKAVIFIEIDKTTNYGKIIDVEPAPAYYTKAFQRSLHTMPIKPLDVHN